jgi:heme/copper-type cytochrome/quinol oxidase subunit 4
MSDTSSTSSFDDSASDGSLRPALIGAVVSVVLSFIPFSPVLGGAVAGYLHKREGARVGAIAGVLAAIPLALLVFLFFGVFGFFAISPGGGVGVPGGFILVLLVGMLVAALYTVALSALGGFLGVYLADEL